MGLLNNVTDIKKITRIYTNDQSFEIVSIIRVQMYFYYDLTDSK